MQRHITKLCHSCSTLDNTKDDSRKFHFSNRYLTYLDIGNEFDQTLII